ncbi:hypothetical protein HMPREF9257_0516 [Eremococcus coleocola ACS-139-V-Col8]|uniref:Uncharacterized protein n=1 Tax=Eremococcus coleocola ACS-139-V-Col8 TaxID=908337 RepID=E4KQG0_9LACT|nr:hypothetical protein HMPREF9257_0516 [Eremococcus coleocola ACS-139-V-Col8]
MSDEPIMYEGDIIFIINHRKGIVENQVILYNDVKYEITKVDYFEDYKSDIVIVGKSIN